MTMRIEGGQNHFVDGLKEGIGGFVWQAWLGDMARVFVNHGDFVSEITKD